MNRFLALPALLLTLTSCQSLLSPNASELTLRTDSVKSNCVDPTSSPPIVISPDCYKVYKLPGNALYDTFGLNTVKGFTYLEGYESTILVRATEVRNPPADASSLEYSLIRVVDQKKVP